jgi:hypothetical protein
VLARTAEPGKPHGLRERRNTKRITCNRCAALAALQSHGRRRPTVLRAGNQRGINSVRSDRRTGKPGLRLEVPRYVPLELQFGLTRFQSASLSLRRRGGFPPHSPHPYFTQPWRPGKGLLHIRGLEGYEGEGVEAVKLCNQAPGQAILSQPLL